jgi:glycosyltransferase involved in cell wall biosynthesis
MLMEAQAAGVPAVAMDCSAGVRQLMGVGTPQPWGLTVPAGDVSGFANALRTLMDAPQERERLGILAREAMRTYALNAVLDDWEKLFARCVTGAH